VLTSAHTLRALAICFHSGAHKGELGFLASVECWAWSHVAGECVSLFLGAAAMSHRAAPVTRPVSRAEHFLLPANRDRPGRPLFAKSSLSYFLLAPAGTATKLLVFFGPSHFVSQCPQF